MKKIFTVMMSILLALCMALGLAACGGDGGTGDQTDDPGTGPGPDGSKPSAPVTSTALDEFGLPATLATINIVADDGADITGSMLNQPYKACSVTVTGGREGEDMSGVRARVRIRGNNTASFPKKSYRIKFDGKQSLLGLHGGREYRNWVLLASYKDVSFLRDAVVFEFGKQTLAKNGYYCSDYSYAKVNINGVYNGVYLVAEQQQVNSGRVDIAEPAANYAGTDIGYLVEYDGNARFTENSSDYFNFDYASYPIKCEDGKSVVPKQWFGSNIYYTIKSDHYSTYQYNFAKSYVTTAFEIIYEAVQNENYLKFDTSYSAAVHDSAVYSSKAAVEKVLDLDAFVDMFLLQELACDNDVDFSSFFMSFDMSETGSKKLVMQAPWDFDSGLGMMRGQERVEKIYTANVSTNAAKGLNPWLAVLWKASWFRTMCAERWAELVSSGVTARLTRLIDAVTSGYSSDFAANYTKWDNLGKYTDEEVQSSTVLGFRTHGDASAYLKTWVTNRVLYLTSYFANIK